MTRDTGVGWIARLIVSDVKSPVPHSTRGTTLLVGSEYSHLIGCNPWRSCFELGQALSMGSGYPKSVAWGSLYPKPNVYGCCLKYHFPKCHPPVQSANVPKSIFLLPGFRSSPESDLMLRVQLKRLLLPLLSRPDLLFDACDFSGGACLPSTSHLNSPPWPHPHTASIKPSLPASVLFLPVPPTMTFSSKSSHSPSRHHSTVTWHLATFCFSFMHVSLYLDYEWGLPALDKQLPEICIKSSIATLLGLTFFSFSFLFLCGSYDRHSTFNAFFLSMRWLSAFTRQPLPKV